MTRGSGLDKLLAPLRLHLYPARAFPVPGQPIELLHLGADPRHLVGELGMTGILQTWTRDLRYHPHIPYLVPGGALTKTGWVRPPQPKILIPAKPLAVRMRNR